MVLLTTFSHFKFFCRRNGVLLTAFSHFKFFPHFLFGNLICLSISRQSNIRSAFVMSKEQACLEDLDGLMVRAIPLET